MTCAASWRMSSSAAALSRVTISILASLVIWSERSARLPSSAIATAFLASEFEIDSATALPVTPGSKLFWLPSGKVRTGMGRLLAHSCGPSR